MKTINKNSGFTLIETLVYVFILAVIILAVIGFLVGILTTLRSLQITRNINEASSISMERMTREIRSADNLNLISSSLSLNPSDLTINSTENGSSVTKRFFIENGRLKITETPGITTSLFPDNIIASDFIVHQINNINSEGVKIEMTLYDDRSATSTVRSFYSSVILRGSYAN